MPNSYPPKTYNAVKRAYIQENKSPSVIAAEMAHQPSRQTITLWAKKKNKDGKTWHDLRVEYRDKLYEEISPQNLAAQILRRIRDLFDEGLSNEKTADALAKYQASLAKLTEPKFQLPTMYYMLTEMLKFFRLNYPKIVNKKFLSALQDFKNHLRKTITD